MRANGRKWEHFTAASFRIILGGRWDSMDLLTLCPHRSAWLCSLSSQLQGHISMHTSWSSPQLFVGLSHFFFTMHHIFIALTEGQCNWDILTFFPSVWWKKKPKTFSPICFKLRACPCSTTQNNVPAHPGLEWVVYRAGLKKPTNLSDLKLSKDPVPQKTSLTASPVPVFQMWSQLLCFILWNKNFTSIGSY